MTDEPAPDTYPSGIPRSVEPLQTGSVPEVLLVTGMSGAGRSKAADVLSDQGWYVVDNLPPQMLRDMVSMAGRGGYRLLAAVVDARGGAFFSDVESVIDELKQADVNVRVLFLDTSDEALVARFEDVRRPHPLQGDGTLLDGIRKEREVLSEVRDRADVVIDTSHYSVHDFADRLVEEFGEATDRDLRINVTSFGFKHGVPSDAEFVADVRFLDNPHWIPDLKPLTGRDAAVRDYVLGADGAQEFLDAYLASLEVALRGYRAHDKHFVSVAVGCTGGRHRSVAMAEALGAALAERGHDVRVTHRDATPAAK